MTAKKNTPIYSLIIWIVALTTVAATPNIHKDALIVPKVAVLFCGTLLLLPYIRSLVNLNKHYKIIKFLGLILTLMLVQMIISMVLSNSPIEQQIFGRTGRGLGLITWGSILILCLLSGASINQANSKKLLSGLGLSGAFALIYSIFQSYGLDFFPWDSKTNGVIGTLGNPNFVSSFSSMISLPILVYITSTVKAKKTKILVNIFTLIFLIFAIYRAESTQGYLTVILAFTIFFLIYIWYKNKYIFFGSLFSFILGVIFILAGVLNSGPLANYLYKVSVQSRGEFWGSALSVANAHPLFGVGLDSFGDYFLKFRKAAVINEYTDSAHNYFLDYAANTGYIFMLLNIFLILLTLLSFLKLQWKLSRFDGFIASLFSSYIVFLAQSLISPISIPLILWGFIISGSIIGLASIEESPIQTFISKPVIRFNFLSLFTLLLGVLVIFPYANADRLQLQAMNNGDGDLAIKVAKMYPESVVRYSVLSRALLESGLSGPALDLARSAVDFNPNSPALWALLVINQSAPIDERKAAYEILLKIDPLNKELINFKF